MTTHNLQYHNHHHHRQQINTTRDHFNLSQFVDYYNVSNPNSIFTKDSFNLQKQQRKELVMIRIRKHASDIKLKKTGKANIQHKLLQLIRSQSVIKTKSKEPVSVLKKDNSETNYQHTNESIPKRITHTAIPGPKTARLSRSVSKKSWISNNRSPVVDGKRLVLSQLSNIDNSLPRFSMKDPTSKSKSKIGGIKTARRYQKKLDFKIGELSPWVNDQESIDY